MQKQIWWSSALLVAMSCTSAWSAESGDGLTKTRPEMKKRIEGLKKREARIPLPELTPEEVAPEETGAAGH